MISMREEDFQREVKVVIVGNGGVGKTSLIRQFCKSQFPEVYKKTIGVDFLEKHIFVKSLQEDVKLMLWDTAGQEEFNSMTRSYYRGAKAAVICFSTIDRHSFESVESWKKKVEEQCGRIPTVLVQNKVDLLDQATVERYLFHVNHENILSFYEADARASVRMSCTSMPKSAMHMERMTTITKTANKQDWTWKPILNLFTDDL